MLVPVNMHAACACAYCNVAEEGPNLVPAMVMRVLVKACQQQEITVETVKSLGIDFMMLACFENGDLSIIRHPQ